MDNNEYEDIKVSAITLDHLSRGLYRSTGAVLKELVSNAYDADATEIRINLNSPDFDYLSFIDNGTGMSKEEFERYFNNEGIGTCVKGTGNYTDKYNRSIIGRLGIGMFAVGQICHSFYIESHYLNGEGNPEAYEAHIVLYDTDVSTMEEELEEIKEKGADKTYYQAGKWKLNDKEYSEKKHGFRIYTSDVRTTFKNEMRDGLHKALVASKTRGVPFKQSEIFDKYFSIKPSIHEWDSYLETIWELSILCPVPYSLSLGGLPISEEAFPVSEKESDDYKKALAILKDRQDQLINNEFEVIFEGINLRRYIRLPSTPVTISKLFPIKFDQRVGGKRLKFTGYLFAQIPKQVKPKELNGIQIRLKNVGIGGYQSTFLNYHKKTPTIRREWVSGEIFIDEGLEDALNIDRDSFNEHDEHYKKMKSVVHEQLDIIFPIINRIHRRLTDEKRVRKLKAIRKDLEKMISKQLKGKYSISEEKITEDSRPVLIDEDTNTVIINTASAPSKRKKVNETLTPIELAYIIAMRATDDEDERLTAFRDILINVLDRIL